jgi:signal peptidase II
MPDPFRNPAAIARFALTAAIGVGLDLWTKSLAVEHLVERGPSYPVIPNWLEFQLQENRGAVFGIGQGYRFLFIFISILAIIFLLRLFARSAGRRIYQIVLGMLLAGVLGNFYDRVFLAHVRDMIHILPGWPRVFPWIFNIADSLLCVGVSLMILYSIFYPQTVEAAKNA